MLVHHHMVRSRGPSSVPQAPPASAPELVRLHRLSLQEEQIRHAAEVARAAERIRELEILGNKLEAENAELRARLERKGR